MERQVAEQAKVLSLGRKEADIDRLRARLHETEALLRLILGLSTNFIILSPEEVDEAIRDVLKAIGSFAKADRSYVFQFSDNGATLSKTHEWCAQNIESTLQRAQGLAAASLPWFCERITNFEAVHIPDVAGLPPEAARERAVFTEEGTRALVAVPIMSGYSIMGFIGFDSVRSRQAWSENVIAMLKMVGEMFAYALSRNRAESALRESESKYRALFENANDAIFVIKDERFAGYNTKTLQIFGCTKGEIDGHSLVEFSPPLQPDGSESARKLGEKIDAASSDRPQFFEWQYRRGDGTLFDAEVSLSRILIGEEVVLQGIVRDITDRKRAQEQLDKTLENLRNAMGGTIRVIAQVVETKDPYTAGHQRRVSNLARAIGTEMGLSRDIIEGIRMAGVIHDIGKVSVPAEILSKPGKLTNKEFELIKDHPQTGFDILKDVEFPWPIADIVLQHHEKLDGSGYPQGLKDDQICLEARIVAVADVVEAIASHRPYRPSLGIKVALEEISRNKGVLYDAGAVDACLRLFEEKGFTFT